MCIGRKEGSNGGGRDGNDDRRTNGSRGGRGLGLVVSGPATAIATSQVVECGHCRRPLPSPPPSRSLLLKKKFPFSVVSHLQRSLHTPHRDSNRYSSFKCALKKYDLDGFIEIFLDWNFRVCVCLFPRSWVAVQWPCRRLRLLFRILELWFKQ